MNATSMKLTQSRTIGRDIIDLVFLAILIVLGAVFTIVFTDHKEQEARYSYLKMTQNEIDHVMHALKKKSAGDCILIRTNYGFSCRDKSDRLFKIYVKGSGNERL